MRSLQQRQGVSLIELLVVIAIFLVASYFTIPSLVGDSKRNDDQVATVNLTMAHNAARKAWALRNAYDPGRAADDIGQFAPDFSLTSTPELNSAEPDIIYVGIDGPQELTLCNRSASRTFFCLRSDASGKLAGDDGSYARSWGTTLTQARCFLPSRGGQPLDCDPAKGGTSWNPGSRSAHLTSTDVTSAPSITDLDVPLSADRGQITITWNILGQATNAMCATDAGDLDRCDRLDGHTFTDLDPGTHTMRIRLEGPGGATEETLTWERTRANSSLYRDEVLKDNPVAYWRFDETTGARARAEVGGPDLVYYEATLGERGLIYADESRAFSVTGQGRAYARSVPLGIAAGPVTIEAWVNIPSLPTSGAVIKVGSSSEDEGSGVGTGYAIGFGGTNSYGIPSDKITVLYENRRWINTGVSVPSAGIHHLVVRILADGHAHTFLNGVHVHTSAGLAPIAPTGAIHIGGYGASNGEGRHFSGTIDEVAIYNTTLPAARIKAHYDAGRTPAVG